MVCGCVIYITQTNYTQIFFWSRSNIDKKILQNKNRFKIDIYMESCLFLSCRNRLKDSNDYLILFATHPQTWKKPCAPAKLVVLTIFKISKTKEKWTNWYTKNLWCLLHDKRGILVIVHLQKLVTNECTVLLAYSN